MFGSRHSIVVMPARGGRKVQYVCTCGARGWETSSSSRAKQMGKEHVAKANGR
ncbi:hypothetical protein [Streptomyces nodosus]|uniref:hypothetical protein n=1 Tax=Streptomyces nodosus TaxID=40318 RepID=UPI00380F292D